MDAPIPDAGRLSRGWRAGPIVWVCAALLAFYWLVAAFVVIVDPFDIYPWGAPPRLDTHYATQDNVYLARAVAKQPGIDLLVVGSSTAMGLTPDLLRLAFPEAKAPVNVSYGSAQPNDRGIMVDSIIRDSRTPHVMIWVDYMYARPIEGQVMSYPGYMYDDSIVNDLRMVNQTTIVTAFRKLRGAPIFVGPTRQDVELSSRNAATAFHRRGSLDALRRMVADYRPSIDRPGHRSCDDLSALTEGLIPQVRALSAQKRTVDLVIPAYTPGYYYWASPQGATLVLADQLLLRKCLVDAVDGLPGVTIHALDGDIALTSDLAKYTDPGHIGGEPALLELVHSLRDPRLVLNRANVDGYLATLGARVRHYQVYSSVIL